MSQELVRFEDKKSQKSFVGKFNGRRPDKLLKYSVELAHFENQLNSSMDDKMMTCSQESFQMVMLEAASLGLSWNKRLGHCYPIRYGKVCTLTIGYQGLTHLCMRSGVLKSIQGEVVCKKDPVFDHWVDEKGPHIKHQIYTLGDRGPITHAYCIAHYNNGGYHIGVVEAVDLAKIQAAAKTQVIWKKWPIPMSIKSAIRRDWKFWPKDDGGRIEQAMDAMDKTEPMDFGNLAPVEEEPQYITIDGHQEIQLHALVHDFYYDEKGEPAATKAADRWMELLCGVMGIRELKQLPLDRFDEAKTKIQDRLKKVETA